MLGLLAPDVTPKHSSNPRFYTRTHQIGAAPAYGLSRLSVACCQHTAAAGPLLCTLSCFDHGVCAAQHSTIADLFQAAVFGDLGPDVLPQLLVDVHQAWGHPDACHEHDKFPHITTQAPTCIEDRTNNACRCSTQATGAMLTYASAVLLLPSATQKCTACA